MIIELLMVAATATATCACEETSPVSSWSSLVDSLSRWGDPDGASKECLRVIFENPHDSLTSAYAYARLAYEYQRTGRYEEAEAALENSAGMCFTSDSLVQRRQLDLANNAAMKGDYETAKLRYSLLASISLDTEVVVSSLTGLGIGHLMTWQWDKAQVTFREALRYRQDADLVVMDSLLSSSPRPPSKSPRLARWLSTFVPGSGQIYGGAMGDGVNSLIVHAASITLVVLTAKSGRYTEMAILSIPSFLRYYWGNRQNAAAQAMRFNTRQNQMYLRKMLPPRHLCLYHNADGE